MFIDRPGSTAPTISSHMARMDRRAAPVWPKTSLLRSLPAPEMSSREGTQDGFTLIEMVCVMAIIGLLAGVLLPSLPRQTSRSRLESYAIDAASVLKADRNA